MSKLNNDYDSKVHFYGRISVIIFALCTLSLPLTLWLRFGLLPTRSGFLAGLITVYSMTIFSTFGEFLSYAPIIGSAAYYVMVLGGNMVNIRIPSSIVALKACDASANTEEGDIISTIAVAASVITSELIILLGVLLLTPFGQIFANPAIKVGFDQIVPSMFGAIIITTAMSNLKAMIIPAILGTAIIKLALIPTAISIPILILLSVTITTVLYKNNIFFTKSPIKGENEAHSCRR